MMASTTIPVNNMSFKDFLFKNKRNRTILILAAIAVVIQFAVFKYLYPYASYIHGDSFSYLYAAFYNSNVNTYMIGYSRFLRLFSVFTNSDIILVTFQYLSIQSGALFLLFTIFYFYKPSKIVKVVLLCFIILNPLFLHLANQISSDSLFLAVSVLWFSLLLWIINKPNNRIIFWHAIVLLIAFTVRYNALIYPILSTVAFCLCKFPMRKKIVGLCSALLPCLLFVVFTSYNYKKITGYWQYSPFSGWQMANNAMYAYRYVDSAKRKPVPEKFKVLDQMIRQHYDSTRNVKKYPIEAVMAGTFYMWSPGLPLVKYQEQQFKKKPSTSDLRKWAHMGPLYKSYGLYIIKQYPWYFIRYFIMPNSKKYYAPPIEFLESYNSGKDTVMDIAKVWFGYSSKKVGTRMKKGETWVLNYFPILSGIANVVMLCTLLSYLVLKGWRFKPILSGAILLGSIFWSLNAGFTIGASSAALRFQSFPLILTSTFAVLILDWMVLLMKDGHYTFVSPTKEPEKIEQAFQQATF